jgi:hypothetical protein
VCAAHLTSYVPNRETEDPMTAFKHRLNRKRAKAARKKKKIKARKARKASR